MTTAPQTKAERREMMSDLRESISGGRERPRVEA